MFIATFARLRIFYCSLDLLCHLVNAKGYILVILISCIRKPLHQPKTMYSDIGTVLLDSCYRKKIGTAGLISIALVRLLPVTQQLNCSSMWQSVCGSEVSHMIFILFEHLAKSKALLSILDHQTYLRPLR